MISNPCKNFLVLVCANKDLYRIMSNIFDYYSKPKFVGKSSINVFGNNILNKIESHKIYD